MKKTVIVILVTSALYTVAVNMKVKGTTSAAERSFTQKMGIYGPLRRAPEYYRPYKHEKWACCKGKQQCPECPWKYPMKSQMRGRMQGRMHRPMMQGQMGMKHQMQYPMMKGQMPDHMQGQMMKGQMPSRMQGQMMQGQMMQGQMMQKYMGMKHRMRYPMRKRGKIPHEAEVGKTTTESDVKID